MFDPGVRPAAAFLLKHLATEDRDHRKRSTRGCKWHMTTNKYPTLANKDWVVLFKGIHTPENIFTYG